MKGSFLWKSVKATAAAVALSGAVSASALAEDTVKVGYLIPLSGTAAASIGTEMSRATHLAVKHINESGGIAALGGAKLELVEVDTRGDAQVAITEAERLINVEKVSVLIGAFQSSVTFPASAVAEKYQVPWIVDLSAKAEITERGFKYVFRPTQIPSSGNAASAADFIEWVGPKTGVAPKTAAIVYENTDWGQDLANTMRERLTKAGIEIVFDESYPPNSPNLRPLVVKLKGAKPDVISMTSYTGDAIQLQKLVAQLRVDTMGIIGSAAGHVDRTFIPTVGEKETNYVLSTNGWAGYDSAITTPFAHRFWDDFTLEYQADPTEFGVSAYADVWILKNALERGASADPKAIRDALTGTEMMLADSDIAKLVGYSIKFDEKNQNTLKKFVVQQIKDGKYYTVWPEELKPAGYDMVWPAPKWGDR